MNTQPNPTTSQLDACRSIARRAGEAIRAIARDELGEQAKDDGSPVTHADLASNRIITEALHELDASIPIVSEESAPHEAAGSVEEAYWLVDPLDGTKDFLANRDEYGVFIARIDHSLPTLGVVYLPNMDTTYFASAGGGAWKLTGEAPPKRVIVPAASHTPAVATRSASYFSDESRQRLQRVGVGEIIVHGNAINPCIVAEGVADLFVMAGQLNYWDSAVGAVIASEAGCRVADITGADIRYNPAEGLATRGFVVAHPSLNLDDLFDAQAG